MNALELSNNGPKRAEALVAMDRCDWLVLMAVLIVAAIVRFYDLQLMEFTNDQATALSLTSQWVDHGEFPTAGMRSSVGILNPPMFIYLLALPYACNSNPLFVTGAIALASTIAVGLTYVIGRLTISRLGAIAAALLFAFNPWAVLYSRKLWAQDFLPVFSAAILLCLLRINRTRRSRWIAMLPVLLCIEWQLHFSAFIALGSVGLSLAFCYRPGWFRWSYLAAGAALAMLMLGPYLQYLHQRNWSDLRSMSDQVRGFPSFASDSYERVLRAADAAMKETDISSTGNFSYLAGDSLDSLQSAHPTLSTVSNWIDDCVPVLIWAAALRLLIQARLRIKKHPGFPWFDFTDAFGIWMLLIWLLMPLAAYGMSHTGIYPHYLIIAYPATFLVLASSFEMLAKAANYILRKLNVPAVRYLPLVAAVSIAGVWLGYLLVLRSLIIRDGGLRGDYDVAYVYKNGIAAQMAQHVPNPPPQNLLTHVNAGRSWEMRFLLNRAVAARSAAKPIDPVVQNWQVVGSSLIDTFPPLNLSRSLLRLSDGPIQAVGN
jgi:hypothetical protein